ncbi:MAG: tRNA lysidine(34) synthetase TilS [Verrucomicrobiota bacterium]|nr:tRNA lysidine(34) synthetase TilS [Verrucomicrobiota bacterium]
MNNPVQRALNDLSSNKSKCYLVGVSGGVDSVVLVSGLHQIGFKHLIVCHLNHGLRGKDSDKDEALVRRMAKTLKFKCIIARVNIRNLAKKSHSSLETAGRDARYSLFQRLAKLEKAHGIFLAHHGDDQVETFIQRLCRGTGSTGLACMSQESTHGPLTVYRPFLKVRKSELTQFAELNGWKWREDASNATSDFNRNKVRNEIIPLLNQTFGRDVSANILRVIDILQEEQALIPQPTPNGITSVTELRQLAKGEQRRAVHHLLRKVWNVEDVNFEQVEDVMNLLKPGDTPCRINLSRGYHVKRSKGQLVLETPKTKKPASPKGKPALCKKN